jgi:hypothetical protein
MIDESFSPDELALIERLQNAPQPRLRPATFDVIRARMLEAMDSPLPAPQPTPAVPLTTPVIITIVVLVVAAIIAVILIVSQPSATESTPPAATVTAAPPTSAPQLTATLAPTVVTPEATPEATQDVAIVIEGPVESINGNVITIFGNTVEIEPTDPLLSVIQVGDVLRIEGDLELRGGLQVLIAITVIYVEVEVNVNPQSNEVWRDDGSCNNPPPDWAPANGWRRRCGSGSAPQDNGMGMGDDDD